jgi:hypothetical protein
LVLALSLVIAAAGCGESQPPPVYAAVNGYLKALASGNYSTACGWLDGHAQATLVRLSHSRVPCARAFERCLPDRVQALAHDQTQLYYANLVVSTHGSRASATVSGTTVARVVKRVHLARQHGRWKLTTYGDGLTRCGSVRRKSR